MAEKDSSKTGSTIEQLINELREGNETTRRYAAEDLGYGRYTEGIPCLIQALQDPSLAVAEGCANALVQIGGLEVAKQIAEYLGSENVRLRNHASEILNQMGSEAVPVLVEQLKSSDRDVRIFAVDILVNLADQKSCEALIGCLEDPDLNVAAAAAEGIGKIGNYDHIEILEKHLQSETWLQSAIIRSIGLIDGPKAYPIIQPFLNHPDMMVKLSAIQALTRLNDPSVLPDLLDLLRKESMELFGRDLIDAVYKTVEQIDRRRLAQILTNDLLDPLKEIVLGNDIERTIKAIKVIGLINTEQSLMALIDLVPHTITESRKAIVASILDSDPKDLTVFRRVLENKTSTFEQKCLALECIGRSDSEEKDKIIREYLQSSDRILKRITLDSIPADYSPIPFDVLKELLNADHKDIRTSVIKAMGRLQRKEFVDDLIKHLHDTDDDVYETIDDALLEIGKRQEISRLKPFLESFSKQERKIAFEYFGTYYPEQMEQKFIDGLADSSSEIRIISYKGIANLKIATFPIIQKGIQDPVEMVRVQSIRTLSTMSQQAGFLEFVGQIIDSQPSERVKVEICHVMGEKREIDMNSILTILLKDSSSWVQLEAIEAVKKRKDKALLSHLEKLAESNNHELAVAAADAIYYLTE